MKATTIFKLLEAGEFGDFDKNEKKTFTGLASKTTFVSEMRGLLHVIGSIVHEYQKANQTDSIEHYNLRTLYRRILSRWFREHYETVKDAATSLSKQGSALKRISRIPIFSQPYETSPFTKSQGFWMLHDNIPQALRQLNEPQLSEDYIKTFNEMISYIKQFVILDGGSERFYTVKTYKELPVLGEVGKVYYVKSNKTKYKWDGKTYTETDDHVSTRVNDESDNFIFNVMDPDYHEKLAQHTGSVGDQTNQFDIEIVKTLATLKPHERAFIKRILALIPLDKKVQRMDIADQFVALQPEARTQLIKSLNNVTNDDLLLTKFEEFMKWDNTPGNSSDSTTVNSLLFDTLRNDMKSKNNHFDPNEKYDLLLAMTHEHLIPSYVDVINKFNTLDTSIQGIIIKKLKTTSRSLTIEMNDMLIQRGVSEDPNKPVPITNPTQMVGKLDKKYRALGNILLVNTPKDKKMEVMTHFASLPDAIKDKIVDAIAKTDPSMAFPTFINELRKLKKSTT